MVKVSNKGAMIIRITHELVFGAEIFSPSTLSITILNGIAPIAINSDRRKNIVICNQYGLFLIKNVSRQIRVFMI